MDPVSAMSGISLGGPTGLEDVVLGNVGANCVLLFTMLVLGSLIAVV